MLIPQDEVFGDRLDLDLRKLIHEGYWINAICLYRKEMKKRGEDYNINSARKHVRKLMTDMGGEILANEDLKDRLVTLLAEGKKIMAIKIYREERRCGLAESKLYIETLQEALGDEPGQGYRASDYINDEET